MGSRFTFDKKIIIEKIPSMVNVERANSCLLFLCLKNSNLLVISRVLGIYRRKEDPKKASKGES